MINHTLISGQMQGNGQFKIIVLYTEDLILGVHLIENANYREITQNFKGTWQNNII